MLGIKNPCRKNSNFMTMQKLKQFVLTIGCLLSYIVLPALLVSVIVILFSLVYAAWSLAYLWLSRL